VSECTYRGIELEVYETLALVSESKFIALGTKSKPYLIFLNKMESLQCRLESLSSRFTFQGITLGFRVAYFLDTPPWRL
jgi:hypothetical protein